MISSTTSSYFSQLAGQVASSAAATVSGSPGNEFARALRELLENAGKKAGLSPESIQVDVRETESGGQNPALEGRQFVITFLPETANATGTTAADETPSGVGTWKDMLDGNLTQATLNRTSDPTSLLNERLAAVQGASTAYIRNTFDGSSQSLNSSWLSSRDQADAMLDKLNGLGANAEGVEELQMSSGLFGIDYADDRRSFLVNGMNVQMLMERYAKYPVEVADQMTRDELAATAA